VEEIRHTVKPASLIVLYVIVAGLISVPLANAQTSNRASRAGRGQTGYKKPGTASDKNVIIARASWYGAGLKGHRTATGEKLDPNQLTAASTQLPLKSQAVVTNLDNGRSVRVRINDCGPYVRNRSLDLSKRAAQKLAMTHSGITLVRIKLINKPPDAVYCSRPRRKRPANSRTRHSYRAALQL